tara:strand:+ start:2465 stop:3430 length:966 start_codon:yes stop_codon:yes gene_type:complete
LHVEKIHIDQLEKLNITNVFNTKEWINISYDNNFGLLGIFNKSQELIGSFYYYNFKRGKILTQISAPPFSPSCGLFIDDKTINPAQKNTFRKKILALVRDYFEEQKFDIFSLPFPQEYVDMQEFIWKGYSVQPRYTYQLNLSESKEDLLVKMSSERRKNIKKAEKDGIIARKETSFEKAKELIYGTYSKQNIKVNTQVLDSVFSSFSTEENSICYVSYNKEGKAISTVFCVYDKEVCYYILGGYNSEDRHEGAGALAIWSAIKMAQEKGVKTFDFEGSMLPAVEKYFRGFGGEMIPFYSVNKNKWKGNLFLKARNLIKNKQ